MGKAGRWVIGIVAGVLVLALLGIVTLTLLIDPNRFKDEIEARVHTATRRPFEIQGDLDVAWFPWLAVRTGAAQLGNPSSIEGPPLIRWQTLRVGVRLIPLLKGQLVIDRVRLEGVQAHLRRTADGRANWDDLFNSADGGKERPAPELAGIEVRNGVLEYVDERSGQSVRISKWDLDVGAWKPNAIVPIKTGLLFEDSSPNKSLPTAEIELEAQVQFSPLLINAPRWSMRIADARLSGSFTADQQDGKLRARGPLSVNVPSARDFLTNLGVTASLPKDTDVLGPFSLTTSWAYVDGELALKPIALRLDDTSFTGELTRSNGSEPTWAFDLRGDQIDLTRYLITEDKSDEPFELPVDALRALRAEGVLSFAQARFQKAQLKNARLRVVLDQGRIQTE